MSKNGSSLGLTIGAWCALVVNVVSICFYFIYSDYDVIDHFFKYGFYEWGNTGRYIAFVFLSQVITCVCLLLSRQAGSSNNIIGLWMKRRRMEEERRIRELESKN